LDIRQSVFGYKAEEVTGELRKLHVVGLQDLYSHEGDKMKEDGEIHETLWGVHGVSETPDALTSDIRPSLFAGGCKVLGIRARKIN
jgi:hypothetical protein